MRGIVLAAGAASRMPNKLMLYTAEGKPLICSAIDQMLKVDSYLSEIVVVVSPGSVIVPFVRYAYRNSIRGGYLKFVLQPTPGGVIEALKFAAGESDEDMLIMCGDNIYPKHDRWPSLVYSGHSGWAVVREVKDPKARAQLCRWIEAESSYKRSIPEECYPEEKLALSTPWLLPASAVKMYPACKPQDSIHDLLNLHEIRPFVLESAGWWDLGTPASYSKYWETRA